MTEQGLGELVDGDLVLRPRTGGSDGVVFDVALGERLLGQVGVQRIGDDVGLLDLQLDDAALVEAGSEEAASAASPLTHVSADFPPTLLIHGTDDELVPVHASIVMYEALAEAGVPTELHLYAEQRHAFDATPEFGRQCAAEMLLFLDRYVRDRKPARS